VAKALDVSSRTVKRRAQRFTEGRDVFGFPAMNPKAVRGSLMAAVIVTYPPGRKEDADRELESRFEPCLWHVFQMGPFAAGDFASRKTVRDGRTSRRVRASRAGVWSLPRQPPP